MAKTAILTSIDDHVEMIQISIRTLAECCLKGAEEVTPERVKVLYSVVDKHLLGIAADCKKFEQKIKDWEKPSFLSKAKNVLKDKQKLETARKNAKERFAEVKKKVEELEGRYQDFKSIVEIYGVKV